MTNFLEFLNFSQLYVCCCWLTVEVTIDKQSYKNRLVCERSSNKIFKFEYFGAKVSRFSAKTEFKVLAIARAN